MVEESKKTLDNKVSPGLEDPRVSTLRFAFAMQEDDLAQIKDFDPRFKPAEVAHFIKNRIPASVANSFPAKYSSVEIVPFAKNNVKLEELSEYNPDMGGLGVSILKRYGIDPKESFEVPEGYKPDYFAFLLAMGVSKEDMARKKTLFLNETFIKNTMHYWLMAQATNTMKFYQVGSSGALFENPGRDEDGKKVRILRKYSIEPRKEFDLLMMMDSPKNVVKLSYYDRNYRLQIGFYDTDGFELEFIQGKPLEAICRQGIIEENKTIKYSFDILNGLLEMRQAGILYHRDIRPANIMIDEEKDCAIIIDLGMASTDKDALQVDNRRFGAYKLANDINSLGQLAYYMATGKHIFAHSESQTRSMSDLADEISDYRTKVYSDTTGKLLEQHLMQVDAEIKHEPLRDIIKACLKAGPDDHDKIMKMFEDYRK